MSTCNWIKRVEAYIDGETTDSPSVEAHLRACAPCASHRDDLLMIRSAVSGMGEAPVLSDNQFPAFMDGIQQELSRSHRRPGGFWAVLSLSMAALVIAIATFSIFTGPGPVKANEVESVSTQLDGATVHWDNSDDGVTTIWISSAEDDI